MVDLTLYIYKGEYCTNEDTRMIYHQGLVDVEFYPIDCNSGGIPISPDEPIVLEFTITPVTGDMPPVLKGDVDMTFIDHTNETNSIMEFFDSWCDIVREVEHVRG